MILTIVILILLGHALFRGFRRGLVLELIYAAGYILVLVFARTYASALGAQLERWLTISSVSYSVAFMLLTSIGWIAIHYIGRLSRVITFLPVIKQVNSIAGGAVGVVITYLILFVVLLVSTVIPNEQWQAQLKESVVAQAMITKTPQLGENLLQKYFFPADNTDNSNTTDTDSTSSSI
jgi:uncharacterized membrane protein required for colicin V production